MDLQGGAGKGDAANGQALAELPLPWVTFVFDSKTHPVTSKLKQLKPTPEIQNLGVRKRSRRVSRFSDQNGVPTSHCVSAGHRRSLLCRRRG
ncbi:hypothetical protein GUJ93_ZPchr0016g2514 [Zizania palustris]|uniref:Uncharacterized protein n=1 Tax=Zizania palustris TaxID=103762 RepID=A0A8J5SZ40_ZIZPA|nr:hypothetical protein GUJ93_ZPchr0016g2514 [Zizania palustris]